MRVSRVVVLNDFCEGRGGATAMALRSAELLRGENVPVTFISGDRGVSHPLHHLGVEHVSLGGLAVSTARLRTAVSGLWNTRTQEQIAGWIEQHDTPGTVYHLHGWHKILSPSVFGALQKVAARTTVHAHDFFLACPNGAFMLYPDQQVCRLRPMSGACLATNCDRQSYAHKAYRLVRQGIQNRAVANAAGDMPLAVLLIHEKMRSYFERSDFAHEQLTTLLNPCHPFSTAPVPAARNREFFFVGRLDPEKGPLDFAVAAKQARVAATMIGEGPERAVLERDFRSVRLSGWKTQLEIEHLIQDARCLVVPSRYPEPFGLVIVEALSSGIPVIVSSHSFLAADVERLGVGLAVDTADVNALSAALRKLADDDELVAEMSQRALESVGELASTPEQWKTGLLDHYEQLLRRASSATVRRPLQRG